MGKKHENTLRLSPNDPIWSPGVAFECSLPPVCCLAAWIERDQLSYHWTHSNWWTSNHIFLQEGKSRYIHSIIEIQPTYPSPHFSFQLFWIIVAYPTHQNYCRLPLPSISIVPAAEDGIGGSAGLTVRRGHSWAQTIRMDLIFPYFRGTLPQTNFQALHMGRWSKTIQKQCFFF